MGVSDKLGEYVELWSELEERVMSCLAYSDMYYLGDLKQIDRVYSQEGVECMRCSFEYVDEYESELDNCREVDIPVSVLDLGKQEWTQYWLNESRKEDERAKREEMHRALILASNEHEIVQNAIKEGVAGEMWRYEDRERFIDEYMKGKQE